LREFLPAVDPGRQWEVINAGASVTQAMHRSPRGSGADPVERAATIKSTIHRTKKPHEPGWLIRVVKNIILD